MFSDHPSVKKALLERNDRIAAFWLSEPHVRNKIDASMMHKKVLVIDAEDSFTQMLAQKLKSIGLLPTVRKYDSASLLKGKWDLFVMGPGPGDPSNIKDPKIERLRSVLDILLSKSLPFLAVCLSHQILCAQLGLLLHRKTSPNQGKQAEIDFFGTLERVGFYNTYVGKCDKDQIKNLEKKGIKICLDSASQEIHALKGSHFFSVQFHPESLLTLN